MSLGKCKYCGISFERLIVEALLVDAGCKVCPSPTYCSESPNHKHE